MVLGAPVGYPLWYSINMLLGLELCYYFGAWEGYFVEVSLVTLYGLMIGTLEGSLVGISLGIPLGYPLKYPNPGAELPGMLLSAPIGLWFSSEAVRCLCFCRSLMNWHEFTWWGVGISCVHPCGCFITSKINSIRYYKLLELLTLSLPPTWLIPTSGGRWISSKLASNLSMTLTLDMD